MDTIPILYDFPVSTFAAISIVGHTPPVLALVTKPIKTLLAGEELEIHLREIERVKRLKEENAQRKRREDELALVRI